MTACDHTPDLPTGSPPEDFTVLVDTADPHTGLVLVHLVGELDVCSGPALAAALEGLGAEGQPPEGGTVLLDLSRLTFMDTAGLGGLADERAALIARGWRVCPTAAQPRVVWLLGYADSHGWLPSDFLCVDVELAWSSVTQGFSTCSVDGTPVA